jgi:hypothetical protein
LREDLEASARSSVLRPARGCSAADSFRVRLDRLVRRQMAGERQGQFHWRPGDNDFYGLGLLESGAFSFGRRGVQIHKQQLYAVINNLFDSSTPVLGYPPRDQRPGGLRFVF